MEFREGYRGALLGLAIGDALGTTLEFSSRTTHGAREAMDACRYFAGVLLGALQGRPKS